MAFPEEKRIRREEKQKITHRKTYNTVADIRLLVYRVIVYRLMPLNISIYSSFSFSLFYTHRN